MRLVVVPGAEERSPRVEPASGIDCVIVGHNDPSFHELAERARATADVSALYEDAKLNSVLVGGRRLHYLELLNHALGAATGRNVRLSSFEQPSLAVCYLASYLGARGLSVEILNFFTHEQERLLALLAQGPRSVAITTTYYTDASPVAEIVAFVRRHAPETKIVLGGPYIFRLCSTHDATTQDYFFRELGADFYVFDAQGEATLAALTAELRRGNQASFEDIPNLIWTRDGRTFRRTRRELEHNDLNANRVHWTAFEPSLLRPTVYLRTARSCPYACSFCVYPLMAGDHEVSDVETVIQELREVREAGAKNVVFVDDTFNVPLPRFKRLLRRMIEEKLDLRWMSFFRCSNADDEAFALMRDSGCAFAFLGIESGDADVLRQMDKFADLRRYELGIRKMEEYGIATHASLIVGHPGETPESVRNTIDFIQRSRPSFFAAQIFFHDPRAPLAGRADALGLQGSGYCWTHATMDWREAIRQTRRIVEEVRDSALTSSYSLGCWGMFYLLSQGLDLERIRAFLAVTRRMVLAGLDEREAPDELEKLVAMLGSARV